GTKVLHRMPLFISESLEFRRLLSGPTFTINFEDDGTYASYHSSIQTDLQAAANVWSAQIQSSSTIDLLVRFDATLNAPTLATSYFPDSTFLGRDGNFNVRRD